MPRIVITHAVADVDKWLKSKSERAESIGGLGGTNVVDYVAHDGSTAASVTFDTDDVANVTRAITSPPPELAAGMESHGVIPPLTIYVET